VSKKRLNTTAIENDLQDSVFFSSPIVRRDADPVHEPEHQNSSDHATPLTTSSPLQRPEPPTTERPLDRSSVRTDDRPGEHPSELPSVSPTVRTPGRRIRHIQRHAFEFYQDQIQRLQAISLAEKALGEKGSMSEMVRAAVDAYLATRDEE
jgi:hypothetical protein